MNGSHRLELLLEDRRLSEEEFDEAELIGLWRRAVSSWQDAGVTGLTAEGALVRAYDAARQAAVTVLAAHGLRVKGQGHHYITFYALEALEHPDLAGFGNQFEGIRNSRHMAVYEAGVDPVALAEDLATLKEVVGRFLPVARRIVVTLRTGLDSRLNPASIS